MLKNLTKLVLDASGAVNTVTEKVTAAIESLLTPALIIAATAGLLYAVYLGIVMAKAEEAGKRDEAKKRVINVVVALVTVVVLILLLKLFINLVRSGSLF